MPRPSRLRVYEPSLLPALLCALPGLLAGAGCAPGGEPAGATPPPVRTMSDEIPLAAPVPTPVAGRWPAAAFDGAQYLAVWEDLRAGRPMLYGARVAADGAALDPAGFPILDAVRVDEDTPAYRPAIAFGGGTFLIVVQGGGEILGVRVSRAGEVLDPDGFVISDVAHRLSRPALAWDGAAFLVAWSYEAEEQGGPGSGVYRARVTPDGAVLDPGGARAYEYQGEVRPGQARPISVSFDGTNHLLSWPDDENIYAGRIARDGTLVDTSAFVVHAGGGRLWRHLGAPVGFDGSHHVIAWLRELDDPNGMILRLMAARVTLAGEVLDPDGILLWEDIGDATTSVDRLHVQSGGGRSVVLMSWRATGDHLLALPLVVVEITAEGAVSPHPADEVARGLDATLAAHPDGALLLWRDGDQAYDSYPTIVGTRLDAAGTPVAGSVVAPASPASRQEPQAVAYGDQRFLVLWTDARDPAAEGKTLYGARLDADGTLLDSEPIKLSDEAAFQADVVFDGKSFVVTWARYWDDGPVQTVRVSPDGELLDAESLPERLSFTDGGLASASDGTRTLFACDAFNGSVGGFSVVLLDQDGVWGAPVMLPWSGEWDSVRGLAMASSGDGFLVVWHDREEVFGQHVDIDGQLVGEELRIVEPEADVQIGGLDVAFGGGNYLVAWETPAGLQIARVTPAGQVLDPGGKRIVSPGITPGVAFTLAPSLVFDGERFVLAWHAPGDEDDASSAELHGAALDTAGEVLQQFVISKQPESEGAPLLATGAPGQSLVAYSRFVPGAPNDARRAVARLLTFE